MQPARKALHDGRHLGRVGHGLMRIRRARWLRGIDSVRPSRDANNRAVVVSASVSWSIGQDGAAVDVFDCLEILTPSR
jgi:hypothetical protein